MTRRLDISLAVCIGLLMTNSAFAGETHTGSGLVCSDCHTMHYSAQHNYWGGPAAPFDGTGPNPKLLKTTTNELCTSCHDGTAFAPDVLGDPTDNYPRQAGALNTSGSGGYQEWTGHTLGSKAVAPGGTWSNPITGLVCTDCHASHGMKSQFRNLITSDTPGDKFENKSLTYAIGNTNDLTKDVWLRPGSSNAERYGIAGTQFNEPNPTESRYGQWCGSCHANFHGKGASANVGGASGGDGGATPWIRHPTADVNIGAYSGLTSSLGTYQSHANKVKVMSTAGKWDTGAAFLGSVNVRGSADLTPSCFSCHKAHGNRNPFGLIYMSGTGTVTEEGDTGGQGLGDLCKQCHVV